MTDKPNTPQDHAHFSASGSHKWLNCAGSLLMEKDIPNISTTFADEGTAAHELASWCLTKGLNAEHYKGTKLQIINGKYHPSKKKLPEDITSESMWVVNDDMVENVQVYLDLVHTHAAVNKAKLFIEQRVDFSDHIGVSGSFGTSDVVVVTDDEITIIDLKYGRGVEVDADDNPQLMLYALGTLDKFLYVYDPTHIRLVICQPRRNHISEWVCSKDALLQFAQEARSKAAVARGVRPEQLGLGSVYLTPGEKQCQFCRAKGNCPALTAKVMYDITQDFVDMANELDVEESLTAAIDPRNIGGMTYEQLSNALKAAPLVELWLKGTKERAFSEMVRGQSIPGFKLVRGRKGHKKWDEAQMDEIKAQMYHVLGGKIYDPPKLVTPAVAEKMMKPYPEVWKDVITPRILQPDGKLTIAPESDKRPPVEIQNINDAMADLAEEGDD